jgi:N-acetylglucosaminyl-diphospho-decaprenol L-rhamnosyltransferase
VTLQPNAIADIRIQVINYRTKTYLLDCLRTLFQSLEASPIRYTLAVLDNASGDDLSDLGSLFPGQQIEMHQGTHNIGFGAGHNFLSRQGEANFLFLVNPDTQFLQPQTPQKLLQRAIESGAQVIGPRLATGEGKTQKWDHSELEGWLARIALASGNSYWRERNHPTEAAWVSGAAFMIEKAWFERLGGFDEKFFLYKEEEELCWRLRALGGQVLYDPTISVMHHCGVVARRSEHLRQSTDYFLQKHFHARPGYRVFRLLNALLH